MRVEKKYFNGIDLENENRFSKGGDFKYALNLHVNTSEYENVGGVENVRGNLQTLYALPAGINTVIGSYENKINASCIYFVHNSLNSHLILAYSPSAGVSQIFAGAILNFQINYLITGVAVVENMLFWTDGINPPRKINIPKASANLYLTPLIEQQIDLIKHPPLYPCLVTYKKDSTKKLNYVSGKTFQFRTRYIYHDFEKSALSPISELPIDYSTANPKTSEYNYIELRYGLDLLENTLPLQTAQVRDIVIGVEILVRETNEGVWKLVETVADYATKNYTYKFYNDGAYSSIDTFEAVKLFDSVPIYCKALSVMKDRIFTANHTESYDLIDLDIEFDISFLEYGKKPLDVVIDPTALEINLVNDTDYFWNETANSGNPYIVINELLLGVYVVPASFTSDLKVTINYLATFQDNGEMFIGFYKNGVNFYGYVVPASTSLTGDTLDIIAPNSFLAAGDLLSIRIVNTASYFPAEGQTPEFFGGFNINLYSTTLTNSNITSSAAALEVPATGHLKRGGTYQFGIVYYDRANRSSSVCWQGNVLINTVATQDKTAKFSLPFFTEDLNKYYPSKYPADTFARGIPQISWKIKHQAPIWATHYAWVRTENTAYNRFLQFVIQNAIYVKEFKQAEISPSIPPDRSEYSKYTLDGAVIVDLTSGEATELYLDLENIVYFKDKNSDSTINTFIPEGNDRVRLMVKGDGTTWETFIDVPIKAIRGKYIVISLKDFSGLLPTVLVGSIVELYTPQKKVENELFYEISETYKILNPHTVNRSHSKGRTRPNPAYVAADQAGATPASGTFQGGDTYYRQRAMFWKTPQNAGAGNFTGETKRPFFIEDSSISDFFISEDSDIGRTNAIIFGDRQVYRKTAVRFSNKFLSGTKINGLNEFEALNEKVLPVEYGGITKLQIASNNQNEGNVLIALHETEAVSMYINEAQFRDTKGSQIIAVSDDVIPSFNTLRGGHGCVHPESVAQFDGNVYWFDSRRGAVCRYNLNGAFPISDYGMPNYFFDLGKKTQQTPQKVIGVFDAFFKEYILSFSDEAETHHFSEKANRWEGRFSFLPEYFGRVGNKVLHFLDGDCWVAGENTLYNNFFGVQYNSELHYVSNENPTIDKVFLTHFVQSSGLWVAYEVSNDNGQLSTLTQANYKDSGANSNRIESAYYADLLRNVNTVATPNALFEGDEMRSEYLLVKLRNTDTNYQRLYFSSIGYIRSSGA